MFQDLEALPRSVEEVVKLAKMVFVDRLAFTERALKSARNAAINEKPTEMPDVWAVLRSMATILHDLHFSGEAGGNIVANYQSRTTYGLALTEGRTTKDDGGLMKLRRDVWDDGEIDISAHVKYGDNRPPKILRVHYYPDHKKNILVIGHCGDHLDTSGTRRL